MSVTGTLAALATVLAAGWGLVNGVDDVSHHLHQFGRAVGNLLVGALVLNVIISTIDFARLLKRLFLSRPSPRTALRAMLAGCVVVGLVAFLQIEAHLVWIYWPVLVAGILGGLLPVAAGTAIEAMGAGDWPLPGYIHMPPLNTSGMTDAQKKEAEDRHFIARMPVPMRSLLGL